LRSLNIGVYAPTRCSATAVVISGFIPARTAGGGIEGCGTERLVVPWRFASVIASVLIVAAILLVIPCLLARGVKLLRIPRNENCLSIERRL